jgi:tRNA pseudouridine38-40 synthase
MRYFVRLSYLGTDFHGSQRQPNGISVQEVMEQAFSTILRCPVSLVFAGRTDAGVHAREMFAHFETGLPVPDGLAARLNSLLPSSVAVSGLWPVPPDAHARFSAVARTYEYHIISSKNPFLEGRAARVAPGLDFGAMNAAASLLLGRHDFASFCRAHTDVKTTFCTVTRAGWEVGPDGDTAVFTVTADRFLRNMVRALVGTLFEVGRGKLSQEGFAQVMEARNRCVAGQSVPACGLYLVRIAYPFPLADGFTSIVPAVSGVSAVPEMSAGGLE